MHNLVSLEIGQPVFWKRKNIFGYYIAFWPKLNRIVYSYDLFSLRRYEDVPYTIFYNEFLINRNEVEFYLNNMIEKEKQKSFIPVSEKVEKKLELQLLQQECMKKLGKSAEDLKKGERNIKRQRKKIQNYFDRNEQIKNDIDYKYLGLWEEFERYFGS